MLFQRRPHATDDELSAYLDGALAAGARERVGGHINGCSTCQEALEGLRAVQTSLRGLRATAPRSFAVREAALRPAPAGRLSMATPLLSGVTAMAMIAFFAVVSFDMSGGDFGATSKKSASSGGAEIMTHNIAGPELSQPLPDAAATDESAYEAAPSAATAGQLRNEQSADSLQPLTVTAAGAAFDSTTAPPAATPEPQVRVSTDDGGGNGMKLRIAEAALAAVALVSGGSAVALVRRQRA